MKQYLKLSYQIVAVFFLSIASASAQDMYAFGGIAHVKTDLSYTYELAPETTQFDFNGTAAFVGVGYTLAQHDNYTVTAELDITAGDLDSGTYLTTGPGSTTPCLTPGEACTANIKSLLSLRLVAAFGEGKVVPFVAAGAAVGKVTGSADTGACGGTCEFDEWLKGFSAGVGVLYNASESFGWRAEFIQTNLNEPSFTNPANVTSDKIKVQQLRVGAQFRF